MPQRTEVTTVTELTRDLSSAINRVQISLTRLSITCGKQTVAERVPATTPNITLRELDMQRNHWSTVFPFLPMPGAFKIL